MAKHNQSTDVNLDESSVHRASPGTQGAGADDDVATESTLDRLEALTGGADEPHDYDAQLGAELDELDASTEEEIDALEVNLRQDDEPANTRDGSGRVVDEVAEEEIARFTEVGPMQADQGVVSVEPGREDTSAVLRRHHANSEIARSEDVVEGNLDEPSDEEIMEPKVDEGTAG